MSLLRRLAFPLAALILSACALVTSVRAERWTFSAGAGGIIGYRGGPGDDGLYLPEWTAGLSTTRALGNHFALRGAVGWSRYGRDVPLLNPDDLSAPATFRQTVSFWRAGFGARLVPFPRSPRQRTCVDLAPIVVWSRWRDRQSQHGWDGEGNRMDRDEVEIRSRLLAGIEAGWSCEWRPRERLRPAIGVRFLATTSPGRVSNMTSGDSRGLLELAFEASLGWAP
jgi:hypothetical protein